jgi:hypothetical protein
MGFWKDYVKTINRGYRTDSSWGSLAAANDIRRKAEEERKKKRAPIAETPSGTGGGFSGSSGGGGGGGGGGSTTLLEDAFKLAKYIAGFAVIAVVVSYLPKDKEHPVYRETNTNRPESSITTPPHNAHSAPLSDSSASVQLSKPLTPAAAPLLSPSSAAPSASPSPSTQPEPVNSVAPALEYGKPPETYQQPKLLDKANFEDTESFSSLPAEERERKLDLANQAKGTRCVFDPQVPGYDAAFVMNGGEDVEFELTKYKYPILVHNDDVITKYVSPPPPALTSHEIELYQEWAGSLIETCNKHIQEMLSSSVPRR